MGIYEKRLESDLWKIRDALSAIANDVERSLKDSLYSLLNGKHKMSYDIMLADRPINRSVRRLDEMCYSFIILHLPSAGHLRFISAIMRTGIALERIGDYAVTISREGVQLPNPPDDILAREIELMAHQSQQVLSKAIMAFLGNNADMAKMTRSMTNQTARIFDNAFESLTNESVNCSKKELFALLVVCNMLLRVSDQAKNLCEETMFAATGESIAPSVYSILFLDEDNSCLSQMAEAIARKTFPDCGIYTSAGRKAADSLNPDMVSFMEKRGIEISNARPKTLNLTPDELSDHYLIISLQGPIKSYLETVPFHSIVQEWDVGSVPAESGNEAAEKQIEKLYREITPLFYDLIEKLRGEKAPCRVE
jgi:phosphate transport system protein